MTKKQTCLKCKDFERFAENAGYCHKHHFQVALELAKRDQVCEGMESGGERE
jgi:hypothetical protein